MYRVFAIFLLAYAICLPQLALHSRTEAEAAGKLAEPSRAERLMTDFQAWLARPINVILAALHKQQQG